MIFQEADGFPLDPDKKDKVTRSDMRSWRVLQYMAELVTPGMGNAKAKQLNWPPLNPDIIAQWKTRRDGFGNDSLEGRRVA